MVFFRRSKSGKNAKAEPKAVVFDKDVKSTVTFSPANKYRKTPRHVKPKTKVRDIPVATIEDALEWLRKVSRHSYIPDASRGADNRKANGVSSDVSQALYSWDRTEVISAYRILRSENVLNEYRLKAYFEGVHGKQIHIKRMKELTSLLDGQASTPKERLNYFIDQDEEEEPKDLACADDIIRSFGTHYFFSFAVMVYNLLCVYAPDKVTFLRDRCAERRKKLSSEWPTPPPEIERALQAFEWKKKYDEDELEDSEEEDPLFAAIGFKSVEDENAAIERESTAMSAADEQSRDWGKFLKKQAAELEREEENRLKAIAEAEREAEAQRIAAEEEQRREQEAAYARKKQEEREALEEKRRQEMEEKRRQEMEERKREQERLQAEREAAELEAMMGSALIAQESAPEEPPAEVEAPAEVEVEAPAAEEENPPVAAIDTEAPVEETVAENNNLVSESSAAEEGSGSDESSVEVMDTIQEKNESEESDPYDSESNDTEKELMGGSSGKENSDASGDNDHIQTWYTDNKAVTSI
eukprot:gene1327-373_t